MLDHMTSNPSDAAKAPLGDASLQIRDGRVSDAESIEAVHYDSREAVYSGNVADWPPEGPDTAGRVERWKRWLADPAIVCLVGVASNEIVGFCTIRASGDEDAESDVAEMPTLYVRPDSWNRGYGRTLCQASLERAKLQGFETVTLWVLEMNTRARAFYRSLGFTEDDTEKVDAGSTERLIARRYRMHLVETDG